MKILNKDLGKVNKFLDEVTFKKGRESLGRTKLKEKLLEPLEAFEKDQVATIDEFDGWTDRDKGYLTTNNKELNKAMDELGKTEIEVTYNSPFRKDFAEALRNYEDDEGVLTGTNADAYALLYEKLVENKEEK